MRKVIFLDQAESSVGPRADTNPRDGLTVLRGDPKFDKNLHRWETYEVESGKKEAFEAYCMGYLHYHEEHIRGGFKLYNIYFDWAEDGKQVTVYLDPPPRKVRADLQEILPEKIFGQNTVQGAVLGSTHNSPAPPPGSTATISDPPPPKQPPPPPL